MRKINRAVKIRIYPNKEQITQIEKTIGCSRFLYNRMLADKIRYYQEEKKMLKNTPAGYKKEYPWLKEVDDDDKIRLNQRKPSKYKGLRRFGPEKNLQRINKFMKERPIFYKNLIQMKENIRFYLRCFYCITKVMILQFNSENRTELARNG